MLTHLLQWLGLTLDPSVSVGNVLSLCGTVASFLTGGLLFVWRVCVWLKRLHTEQIVAATHRDERFNRLEERLAEHELLDRETRDNVARLVGHLIGSGPPAAPIRTLWHP